MASTPLDFLEALASPYRRIDMRDQAFEMIVLRPRREGKPFPVYREWFPVTGRGRREAIVQAAKYSPKYDVYHSFLPREAGHGDAASVSRAGFLFCGIDGNEAGVPGAIELLKSRVSIGRLPKPAILINSGHGLHAYWQLPEVWKFQSLDDQREYATILRRIGLSLGGDKDEVKLPAADVARPQQNPRFPGSLNHKDAPPVPVRILRLSAQTDGLWTREQWSQYLPREKRREVSRFTPIGRHELLALSPRQAEQVAAPAIVGTRNKTLSRILISARKGGYSLEGLTYITRLFCQSNPGYSFREAEAQAKWTLRNVVPTGRRP